MILIWNTQIMFFPIGKPLRIFVKSSAGRTTTQHTIISPYFLGFFLEAHNTQFL